jgi:hypothetical protein
MNDAFVSLSDAVGLFGWVVARLCVVLVLILDCGGVVADVVEIAAVW